jgi:hypothetical protein
MEGIKAAEQLIIFSRYIGRQVVISGLLNHDEETVGILTGIKENALQVSIDNINRWIPVYDGIKLSQIKLLLKPLKKLTSAIIDTANSLPVQAFITPYYQSLGFDMPVYIAPEHPCNCKYVYELNLADYRSAEEIQDQNHAMFVVHGSRERF